MNYKHYKLAPKAAIYYLASPYSHQNPFIKAYRYLAVDYSAAILTNEGFKLLEPISQCHHKALAYELPTGYEFWKTRDREFIKRSDGVFVLTLPGWKESIGVKDELAYAAELGRPIFEVPWSSILDYNLRKEL